MAVFLADGANAGAPSLAFANETNTGIFRPSEGYVIHVVKGRRVLTLEDPGRVGINRDDPVGTLDIAAQSGTIFRTTYNNGFGAWIQEDYGSAGYPSISLQKSLGTTAAPTIITTGFETGRFRCWGYDGAKFVENTRIASRVTGSPALDTMAGVLEFYTNSGSSVTPVHRGSFTSDGYLRFTAGSSGIQFNNDSAATNALNDYEEGTWTPVIFAASGTGTMDGTLTGGSYVKVGKVVTVVGQAALSDVGTLSGAIGISGLPFGRKSGNTAAYACGLSVRNTTSGDVGSYVLESGSFATVGIGKYSGAGTGVGLISEANLTNTTLFIFTFSYVTQ